MAQQSVEQQARQNEQIARQSQAVVEESQKLAEASKELVAKDAEARREMVSAQRELTSQLNEQRANVDAERDELEDERRAMAEQRHRDPVIATSIQTVGLLLACLLPLLVCVFLIHQMYRSEPDEAAVAELLACELLSDQPKLLPVIEHNPDRKPQEPPLDSPPSQTG